MRQFSSMGFALVSVIMLIFDAHLDLLWEFEINQDWNCILGIINARSIFCVMRLK